MFFNRSGYFIRDEQNSIAIMILSTPDKKAYKVGLNEFVDYDEAISYMKWSPEAFKKISKEKFEDLLQNKVCDCKLGEGRNIQMASEPYDFIEEFNKKYSDYSISCGPFGYKITDIKTQGKTTDFCMSHKNYYKKACLNCCKCLDEIDELYKEFGKIIFETITKPKMVEDICNKNKGE